MLAITYLCNPQLQIYLTLMELVFWEGKLRQYVVYRKEENEPTFYTILDMG
jgi:hypothetical protein